MAGLWLWLPEIFVLVEGGETGCVACGGIALDAFEGEVMGICGVTVVVVEPENDCAPAGEDIGSVVFPGLPSVLPVEEAPARVVGDARGVVFAKEEPLERVGPATGCVADWDEFNGVGTGLCWGRRAGDGGGTMGAQGAHRKEA
ncbi:uncharacterized protein PG986_008604 [Apiospora aurea]|uniref:Uncharacterized protein n=1 Tax=Apiospora aurea TaxID=335848 RepID=A0ABR1Q5C5_9PEZI